MSPNRWLALLIASAAIAFAVGVSLEKADTHNEPAGHIDGAAEQDEAAEGAEAEATASAEGEADEDETLLGIDLESTPLVVLAVIASLALAAAAWLRPGSRALLVLISVAMLAFAVLDIREVGHQLDEDETGLAILAGFVAVLHLSAAGLSWRLEGAAGAGAATA